jgi:spore maturation protein CgeB
MRVLCVFGRHDYGDPRRGEGYEFSNFIPALRRLGHDVMFLESWDRSCYRDYVQLSERLLRTVEEGRPDVVLSVMFTYEIWLETWEILRDSGLTATVNWTTDDSWKYASSSRFLAPAFHAFTTTYPEALARYRSDGYDRAMLTQWAANAENLRPPLPARDCTHAVSFVGSAHGERKGWIEALRRRGVEVACFGHGWPHGAVPADEIPRIIRGSVISLNFAKGSRTLDGLRVRRLPQIKARTFEVPGAGGFLLTEWSEGLERFYESGKEIATFRDREGLVKQIHHYLEHPDERDAIAARGFERTGREHLYDQRLAAVLDFALAQSRTFAEGRPAANTGRIDWESFQRASQKHRSTRSLRALRTALVGACTLVWGRSRGRRAARRLVFEASWRMAGRRTYSSAGWGGRMFPDGE